MSDSEIQPAIKSYFFGKGYRDLRQTIVDSWTSNLTSATIYKNKAAAFWNRGGFYFFPAIAVGFSSFSVILFGTIWFFILSILHITILGMFFSTIYLCFSLVWVVEKIYRAMFSIFSACPNCHTKTDIPYYLCSKCRTPHTRLVPGSYGILKRTCQCGEKLPTTFFNGRNHLEARCKNCSREMETGERKPICISIIGGPSVGKTCYLFAATQAIVEEVAPLARWKTEFINSRTKTVYDNIRQRFQRGVVPDKTTDLQATAFNFFISKENWSVEKVMYLYDAAGEAFQRSENLHAHKFYGYLHGFLFLIDPFSIPELVEKLESSLNRDRNAIKPSDMSLEDTYDATIINLEKNHGIKRNQRIGKPCAVVINKVDAMDLERVLGTGAARNYQVRHSLETLEAATDQLCRQFFIQHKLGDFVRKLDAKFKNCRFFTCSALGKGAAETSNAFKPYRVEDPVLWLMGNADRDLVFNKRK